MSKVFCNAGSAKDGVETGLRGGEPKGEGPELTRGGKSASEKRGVGETHSGGRVCKGEESGESTG